MSDAKPYVIWMKPLSKKGLSFKERMSVQKLYDDLDQWITIGIGDDIVTLRHHRKEYEMLVDEAKLRVEDDGKLSQLIPKYVRASLKIELRKPWYKQQTFYWLCWLQLKRLFTRD